MSRPLVKSKQSALCLLLFFDPEASAAMIRIKFKSLISVIGLYFLRLDLCLYWIQWYKETIKHSNPFQPGIIQPQDWLFFYDLFIDFCSKYVTHVLQPGAHQSLLCDNIDK